MVLDLLSNGKRGFPRLTNRTRSGQCHRKCLVNMRIAREQMWNDSAKADSAHQSLQPCFSRDRQAMNAMRRAFHQGQERTSATDAMMVAISADIFADERVARVWSVQSIPATPPSLAGAITRWTVVVSSGRLAGVAGNLPGCEPTSRAGMLAIVPRAG